MSKPSWLNNRFISIFVWILAIGIRLYGSFTPAQYNDMVTFESWSRSLWMHGPLSFFDSTWSDYLPLPILTFAPISVLADFFHAPFGLTFKLVHSFIELVLIHFITRSSKLPFYPITPLLLLSPVLIYDTAFWGQVDAIPSLLALLALSNLLSPKSALLTSAIAFGVAVAYKPIMLLIAPILWIVTLKQKVAWWKLPVFSGIVFFTTAIPTGGVNFIAHIFERILSQADTYPHLTVNAFNLWSLVPQMLWLRDSTIVLSLSGRTLGIGLFVASSFMALNNWRKVNFDPRSSFRIAATILIAFFAFTTRMHERHLLFGLPFLALAVSSQSFLLVPLVLYSLFFVLNLYGAYTWMGHDQIWPFYESTISLISWGVTLTTIMLTTVWSWPDFYSTLKITIKKNVFLVAILLVAILLRTTNLTNPPNYIFDEVYHAFTAREYLHNRIEGWEWWTTPPEGVAYEWTHPPVAKYGMVIGMLLFGENSFGWRIGSAVTGVFSILGIYQLSRALQLSRSTALLATFLVSIEGLHIAQSRIAMNDVYMLNFYIWSLYMAVKTRWKSAAILYGLSLASKWSALYAIVPLALIYLHQYIASSRAQSRDPSTLVGMTPKLLLRVLRLILISVFVYILTFAPFITAGHTWAQWWELHRQMWYYHTHLVATHAYQSTPLQWMFDVRPVWYHVEYLGGKIANIYAIGNPVILWLGLVAIILQLKKIFTYPYSLLYTLYFIFTLPWLFSPRIMFFYHYLPSSVFLSVILATWLSDLSSRTRNGVMIICFIGLITISPMLYAFPLPKEYWDALFKLIPSWK